MLWWSSSINSRFNRALQNKGALKTYSTQPTINQKGGRKRTCGPQCKVCLTPRARSLPRDLLAGHRLRCRSAFDSMSSNSPQARETSTAYRQTDWSQYISCIRYRIAWLPGGSGFGAVLHPVIVVVLKFLVVDRCPTRMSSIFGQWGSLGRLGWIMRAFCSYYAPRISPTQMDAVGCKVSGPIVRMSIDSAVFLCVTVPWQRETERERKRKRERERKRGEREREIVRGRERERRREREREGREEREDSTPRTCHRFAPSCFFIFLRAKTNHFPANGSCDSALGRRRAHMHAQRRLHGAIIEADLALPIACALPPPLSFMVGCVLYVFNAPFQNLQQSKNQKSLSRRKKTLIMHSGNQKKIRKIRRKGSRLSRTYLPSGRGSS